MRSVRDLKGARIGIAYDGEADLDVREAEAKRRWLAQLRQAGLTAADVQWVRLPLPIYSTHGGASAEGGLTGSARYQAYTRREALALLQGEIDALLAWGPAGADALQLTGGRSLERTAAGNEDAAAGSGQPELYAVAVSASLLETEPELTERILAHLQSAAGWAARHPQEALRYAALAAGIPEVAVEAVYSPSLPYRLQLTWDGSVLQLLEQRIAEWSALGALPPAFGASLHRLTDRDLLVRANELHASGQVQAPSAGGRSAFSPYAVADVPPAYFTGRKPAYRIQSDEEALQIARAFADEIRDGASDRDRYRRLPFEEMKRLSESGLLGLVVPKVYGGPEVSTVTLTEIFKLISAADGAIGQIPQNHHFFVKVLELNGTEEQKRFFFEEVLNGAQFGNGLAERGPRSSKLMSTRITRSGEGSWKVNGRKYYCTGSLFASWIPIYADDEEEKRVAVYIPRHTEGLILIDDWSGIGQRTTASGSVVLRDVEVPDAYIVPHWKTFEAPQYFGAFAQIMHAALDVGIAAGAMADAARFVREKTRPSIQSGAARASEEPYLIKRFGELGVKLQAAEALLEKAARAVDAAREQLNEQTAGQSSLLVASAKAVATDVVIEITNALFEAAGTSSMDEKYNLDRHWRNGRIHTLHDPVRWKLHHVGNYYLNGVLPPNQAGL